MKLQNTLIGLFLLFSFHCADRAPNRVVLMTHDSFSVGKALMAAFEKKHGVKVEILKSGSVGHMLNQALLSAKNPVADAMYGVDNAFLGRALREDLFAPYDSPRLSDIPESFRLDAKNRLLPVAYSDVCLNYDRAYFESKGLSPPASLDDLAKDAYRDLTVLSSPVLSSPGLAFLLATIARFGEEGYVDYWRRLADNGVLIVESWSDAYRGHFSATSKGDRPIVLSYASSPPAEVFYAEVKPERAPTAVVTGDGSCFRQIEFVGVFRHAANRERARLLVDFLLDVPFQEGMPLQMFVFPVHSAAKLPEVFKQHAKRAENPLSLDPDRIEKNRERWLETWSETVRH